MPRSARRCASDGARAVVAALAEELAAAPRLDRERFRARREPGQGEDGQKGRALFHPIRVALTGRAEGPELDLAVPAIDRGAELPPIAGMPRILGYRERAAAFARALETSDASRRRSHERAIRIVISQFASLVHVARRDAIYGINPVLEALRARARRPRSACRRAPTSA